MGAFINNTVTDAGVYAAACALSGMELTFTRIVMGSGALAEDQDIRKLEDVLDPEATIDITRHEVQSGNTAILGGVFTNNEAGEGFFWRELGLYAKDPSDPEGSEILYCYGNAGDLAEWIPPSGGQTVIEKNVDILTYVGASANVRVYIAPDAYPTKADFDKLREEVAAANATAREALSVAMDARTIALNAQSVVEGYGNLIDEYASKLKSLEDAVFSDITANPFRLSFENLDGITLTSGVHNVARQRLEC